MTVAGPVLSDLIWFGLVCWQIMALQSSSSSVWKASHFSTRSVPLFLTLSVSLKSLRRSLLLFKTCTSSPPLVESSVRLTGVFQSAPSSVVSALPRESPFPISRSLHVFCALKQIHFRDYPNALWKIQLHYLEKVKIHNICFLFYFITLICWNCIIYSFIFMYLLYLYEWLLWMPFSVYIMMQNRLK